MPEFEKDAYGPQDFYEDQLKHYGFKTNIVNDEPAPVTPKQPVQGFEMNEATGMPVPSKSSMPKRKPVGLANPLSVPRKISPVRPPRPDSPEHTMNKIYRGQDGRFDVSTVRKEQRSATPSGAPSNHLSQPPTPSPRPTPQGTDSNASNASWRSRADSVGQVARRMSNSFREKVDIIKMNRNERAGYVRRKNSGASQNGKFARDSFDSIQRDSLLDFQTSPTVAKPMPGNLSKGEKLALKASKAIDPIRRGRNGSGDSDMLFNMTDMAPPGAMHMCKRCHRATDTFLKDELCTECYNETKKGKNDLFTDPFQFPQGRSTWPETNSPEHGYMKLPNRKIIRLRQTIYEDPGNPFADEVDRLEEVTSKPKQHSLPLRPSSPERTLSAEPASLGSSWPAPRTYRHPSFGERTVPSRIQLHRRSKSVAGPITSPVDPPGDYVAPRSLWRRDTLPTNHVQEGVRDTKFYGFYDDVFAGYSSKGK